MPLRRLSVLAFAFALLVVSAGDARAANPWIGSLSPSSGTAAGGTKVTITGSNLLGAKVTFDGNPATVLSIASTGKSLVCTSPPSARLGKVDVVVTTAGGKWTAFKRFNYLQPAPVVSSLTPDHALIGQSSIQVTIRGDWFQQSGAKAPTVKLGAVSAMSFASISTASLTANFPDDTAGMKDLTIKNPDGQSVTVKDAFERRTAASLEILSGDGQVAAPGSQLPQGLAVLVRDNKGEPAQGAPVHFVFWNGPATPTVNGASTVTDANGVAIATVVLGSQVGHYVFRATSGTLAPVDFEAWGQAPAVKLAFRAQPTSIAAGGALPPIEVLVEDANGATLPKGPRLVSLSVNTNARGAVLKSTTAPSSTAIVATSVDGVATFTGLTVERSGNFTLLATTPNLPAATSAAFDVTPLAPVRLGFVDPPRVVIAGVRFVPAPTIEVEDRYGNSSPLVAPVTIDLSLSPNGVGAVLSGSGSRVTKDSAVFEDCSIAVVATSLTLEARTTGGLLAASSAAFTVAPAGSWVCGYPRSFDASQPSGRSQPAFVSDGKDRAFLFGGGSNDLWCFEMATGRWKQLIAPGAAGSPTGRFSCASAWGDDRMYVVGGYDGTGWRSDLWSYDPKTNAWTQLLPDKAPNGPKARGRAVWTGDRLLFFAFNLDDWTLSTEVSSYDPKTNAWTQEVGPASPTSPNLKWEQEVVWTGSRVIAFARDLSLVSYDPTTRVWETKLKAQAPGSPPYSEFAVTWDGHYVVWVGGDPQGNQPTSTWIYDPKGNSWLNLVDTTVPGTPRGRSAAGLARLGEAVLLWGGAMYGPGAQNDTWLFLPTPAHTTPLSTPTNVTTTGLDSGRVLISWQTASLPWSGYRIERRIAGTTTWVEIGTAGAYSTSFVDDQASAETLYEYRVLVGLPASPLASVSVAGEAGPRAPSGLVATVVTANRIDLAWISTSAAATSFRIERCLAGTNSFAPIATQPASKLTYSDTTLTGGTTYDFRVVGLDAFGASTPSNVASGLTKPSAPTNIYAAGGPGQIVLSWNPSVSATRYTVYRGTKQGVTPGAPGTNRYVTSNAASPLFVSAITWNVRYYFIVTATGPSGESLGSVEVSAVAASAAAHSKPVVHSLPVTFSSIKDACVDRLRQRLYVLDAGTNEIVAVDLRTETVLGKIPCAQGSQALSLSPNGRYLAEVSAIQGFAYWRGGPEAGELLLIDPATFTVSKKLAIGVDPWDVEVLDTGFVYVPGGSNQWTGISIWDQQGNNANVGWGAWMKETITVSPDQRRIVGMGSESPPNVGDWGIHQALGGIVDGWFIARGTANGTPPLAPAINADSTRLLTLGGELLTLAPTTADPDLVLMGQFTDPSAALCASRDARYIFGLDGATGQVIRYDLPNLATTRSTGYDVATNGTAVIARLAPAGDAMVVTTSTNRIVLVPMP